MTIDQIIASLPEYFVVQSGIAIFGAGASEDEALADAAQWGADPRSVATFVGAALCSDKIGSKLMTDRGELGSGDMVLMSRDELLRIEGNAADYLYSADLIDRDGRDALAAREV